VKHRQTRTATALSGKYRARLVRAAEEHAHPDDAENIDSTRKIMKPAVIPSRTGSCNLLPPEGSCSPTHKCGTENARLNGARKLAGC
jgi:hypothetical protein